MTTILKPLDQSWDAIAEIVIEAWDNFSDDVPEDVREEDWTGYALGKFKVMREYAPQLRDLSDNELMHILIDYGVW